METLKHNRTLWLLLGALFVALIAAPFLLTIAGDGQVHLAIAENFARGRPFQYNPNGEIVVASTSPFWTIMLTGFYWLAGDLAPLLLKAAVVLIWLVAAYLLYEVAREQWNFRDVALWGAVGLWLAHTTIVANALGGLENVLAALQLLALALLTTRYRDGLTPPRSTALGLLLGWTWLTRPDGGLFALVILALFGCVLLLRVREDRGRFFPLVVQLAVLVACALLVLLPWYAYQYSITGRLVTDSSLARLYNGRLGALALIPGLLYFHPKALISLATAFLPLAFGFLVALGVWLTEMRHGRAALRALRSATDTLYPRTLALAVVVAGFLFFSFVVGAEAFGRYFLPLYPFFFLAAVEGLRHAYAFLRPRRRLVARAFVILTVLFLAATSLFDYGRRLGPGRFAVHEVLDVIYGPANEQYLSFNVPGLVAAPAARPQQTGVLLHDLGVSGDYAKVAVTEVQLRYFLDARVDVLSLDGRTSAAILDYVDPRTGVPDFARYFEETQPDFVHVNQWCAVGGWLASVLPTHIEENLVCRWEQTTRQMAIGESFFWEGNEVVLVAPELVQIRWRDSALVS